MIPLLCVMQRVRLYYCTIIMYYSIMITPGSIITHYYLFQSPKLADEYVSNVLGMYCGMYHSIVVCIKSVLHIL